MNGAIYTRIVIYVSLFPARSKILMVNRESLNNWEIIQNRKKMNSPG